MSFAGLKKQFNKANQVYQEVHKQSPTDDLQDNKCQYLKNIFHQNDYGFKIVYISKYISHSGSL